MSENCCIFVCGNKSHKEKEMKKRALIPRDRVNEAAISENKDDALRIEDYFDLSKLTEKDVRLISNDIRKFIPHTFESESELNM